MRKIVIIYYILYVFLLGGFIFHTSSDPSIFNKYSLRYFVLLIGIFFSYFFIKKMMVYFTAASTYTVRKRKYKISSFNKRKILILLLTLGGIFLEIYLRNNNIRVKSQPYYLSVDNFHPFLQLKLTPKDNEDNTELNINEFNFRYGQMKKKKTENTYRVFTLGGSTVLNSTIPYELTFQQVLEKKLRDKFTDKKIEIINAGMDGYTSEHSLIQYMFNIREFDPDIIIIWQGINDFTYSCSPSYVTNGRYEHDYSHFLGSTANMVRTYFNYIHEIKLRSFLLDHITHFLRNNLYSDFRTSSLLFSEFEWDSRFKAVPLTQIPSTNAYKRNMEYLIETLKNDGVQIILGNQPYRYTLNESDKKIQWYMQRNCFKDNTYPDIQSLIQGIKRFNTITSEVAKKHDVPFIDLEKNMPKTFIYFTDDVHFTILGNKRIAELLYEFIKEEKLVQ